MKGKGVEPPQWPDASGTSSPLRAHREPTRGGERSSILAGCGKTPVKVHDPTSGQTLELTPLRVWKLAPAARRGVKIALFRSPVTGRYFRAKVPDDYPIERCEEHQKPETSKDSPLNATGLWRSVRERIRGCFRQLWQKL